LKLISEPWDIGPGGYQLGNHPPGFSEWNDKFRDTLRRFWRGDAHQCPELATRLAGSGDLFEHHKRRPWASINYLASHDGFTLEDIVSYQQKHNEANQEENKDGHSENFSANWGAEGPTDDAAIRATRSRVKRAMLATLFFSQGTPMLLAGDELGRSQSGNNNAYCQDNEISWLDWQLADQSENRALADYAARLAALRMAHGSLRMDRFLHGRNEIVPGISDIDWFNEQGSAMEPAHWQDPERRLLALRRAIKSETGALEASLLLLNGSVDDQEFHVNGAGLQWDFVLDSSDPAKPTGGVQDQKVLVPAHSAVLLIGRLDPGQRGS
jgi:glycogen operon protein